MNVTYMNLSSLLYIYIYLLLFYAWIMLLLASIIVYSIYEYLV